eukprot:SAG22_NODE_132_length_18535_cov_8.178021_4_plen_346_part_00
MADMLPQQVRRLRSISAAAAAAAVTPPIVFEKLDTNTSGDSTKAAQGFGQRAQRQPLKFRPDEVDEIVRFFREHGFAVIVGALSGEEVAHLNGFFARTQQEMGERWGLGEERTPQHKNQGLIYSQPLLDHPELDQYVQHRSNYPVVQALLGGEDRPRFQEFNFREAPAGAGDRAMNFHHDAALPGRIDREPYGAPDWLCAIHYITDVDETTPAFAVVPESVRFDSLREVYEARQADYEETPLLGPAGTCVLYDTATYHTRLDGPPEMAANTKCRRTMHQYYARGGWDAATNRGPTRPLTDWNVFPKRLAAHKDPAVRRFFSSWNPAMCELAAVRLRLRLSHLSLD